MDVNQVLDLVAQAGAAENGTRVSLVRPLRVAGHDRWKMMSIRKKSTAIGHVDIPTIEAFDLAARTRFWDSFGVDVVAPTDLQLVSELS